MAFEFHSFGVETTENSSTHTPPLVAADERLLNRIIHDAPHVILADSRLIPDCNNCAANLTQFADSSAAVGLRPAGPGRDFEFISSQIPLSLASLAMAPESRCAVFLNSEQVREAGGFRDVDSPVRELIIRLSQRDTRTVTLLERDISGCSSDTANALPPCDADLPATAPVWPPSSHHWLAAVIKSLHVRQALPHISSDIEASAFHAGVWQINDWLDESHSCSQAIEGAGEGNGDYWHAIMHRREPDAGNARYWFRRVGDHACCGPLADIASQALEECHSPAAELWMNRLGRTEMWDSAAFVDFCQTAQEGSDPDLMQAARRIQWAEMLILLAHTAQQ